MMFIVGAFVGGFICGVAWVVLATKRLERYWDKRHAQNLEFAEAFMGLEEQPHE